MIISGFQGLSGQTDTPSFGSQPGRASFADLWSYDTHSGVWSHESGSFADSGIGNVASEDALRP